MALKRQLPRHRCFVHFKPIAVEVAAPPWLLSQVVELAFGLEDPHSFHPFGFLFHLPASSFGLRYL